jgi:uncharacterized PurR-regulated membrane protein YhhQ (DUF165 family)
LFLAAYGAIQLAPAPFWIAATAQRGVPDLQDAYAQSFGQGLWMIAGSRIAFRLGHVGKRGVCHRIGRVTQERWMGLRATGSTAVSPRFDTWLARYVAFLRGPQHWPVQQGLAVAFVNHR